MILEAHTLEDPKIQRRTELSFRNWMANYNRSYSKPSLADVRAILEIYKKVKEQSLFKSRNFEMLMNHLKSNFNGDP